jgi:hypothetical protein
MDMKKSITQHSICALLLIATSCGQPDEQSIDPGPLVPNSNEPARLETAGGEANLHESRDDDAGAPAPGSDEPAGVEAAGVGTSSHEGYHYFVNHYSNHWPSRSSIYVPFPSSGVGLHFYARWKWYQGYGSRTVCMISNDCGVALTCAQDFDLPYGACTYVFNVDGPYQMQAKVGWFEGDTFQDWWTY